MGNEASKQNYSNELNPHVDSNSMSSNSMSSNSMSSNSMSSNSMSSNSNSGSIVSEPNRHHVNVVYDEQGNPEYVYDACCYITTHGSFPCGTIANASVKDVVSYTIPSERDYPYVKVNVYVVQYSADGVVSMMYNSKQEEVDKFKAVPSGFGIAFGRAVDTAKSVYKSKEDIHFDKFASIVQNATFDSQSIAYFQAIKEIEDDLLDGKADKLPLLHKMASAFKENASRIFYSDCQDRMNDYDEIARTTSLTPDQVLDYNENESFLRHMPDMYTVRKAVSGDKVIDKEFTFMQSDIKSQIDFRGIDITTGADKFEETTYNLRPKVKMFQHSYRGEGNRLPEKTNVRWAISMPLSKLINDYISETVANRCKVLNLVIIDQTCSVFLNCEYDTMPNSDARALAANLRTSGFKGGATGKKRKNRRHRYTRRKQLSKRKTVIKRRNNIKI